MKEWFGLFWREVVDSFPMIARQYLRLFAAPFVGAVREFRDELRRRDAELDAWCARQDRRNGRAA